MQKNQEEHAILVVDHHDKINLLKTPNLKWIYIGSHEGIKYAKNILKENNRIFIGRDIDGVVEAVRENFVDYIGKISQQQSDKTLWYSSRMASKSIQTSMFHQYVYLKVLENRLKDLKEDILVVTDDKEFIYNVSKIFSKEVIILKKKVLSLGKIYRRQVGYVKLLKYCVFWFLSIFFKNHKMDIPDVFIHSWIDERVFLKLPGYNDSYFNDLENVLMSKGHCVGRLAPLRISLRNKRRLNKHFNNIVYPMAYVPLGDFLKSIFTKFTVKISGQDVTSVQDTKVLNTLLENEIYKENSSRSFLDYLLLFCSYKKIGSMIKKDSVLIYPFENQPWEKMFNLAFADFDRIAYQHSIIPYNWLDYRVSQYEDKALMPKTILTIGKKWSSFLRKHYNDSIIEEAGALRFSYLFSGNQKDSINNQAKNIVVILDLVTTISISLQEQLLAFLKRNNLTEYIIKIKPHPFLPKYACLKSSFVGYENCIFVQDSMQELLKNCSLLIASNTSAIFESVLLGIKTLYFIPEEPSLGLEYYLKDSLFIAYEENFLDKFQEALKSLRYPKVDIEDYFSKPDYSVFLKHLKQDQCHQ